MKIKGRLMCAGGAVSVFVMMWCAINPGMTGKLFPLSALAFIGSMVVVGVLMSVACVGTPLTVENSVGDGL